MLIEPICVLAQTDNQQKENCDSQGDDPVEGKLDRDDFESTSDWEDYLSKQPEKQSLKRSVILPAKHLKVTPSLRYTITGLPLKKAIQKTYIGDGEIYVTQRSGSDTYLSRCLIGEDGMSAVCQDKMILKNFGHGQTLEHFVYMEKDYFWVSCKANTAYSERWSMQIGRIQYTPGKTISDYTKICRLSNLNYANMGRKDFGNVKRADAALSDDGKKLIIWIKNIDNEIQYSIYPTSLLNEQLDQKENLSSKYVSFEENKTLAAGCLYSFEQITSDEWILPNGSFQGFDLADDQSVCIAGGGIGDVPGIAVMKKGADGYEYDREITIDNTQIGSEAEIEGIQLRGDCVYFGICDHKVKSAKQYIYSIPRSAVTDESVGHQNIKIVNKKEASCTQDGYTGDIVCMDCGEKLEEGTVIAASGHKWGSAVVKTKATATKKGLKVSVCSVCKQTKQEIIPAKGAPKKGSILKSKTVSYKVTKAGLKGGTVRYMKNSAKVSSVKIPSTVTIEGITYKVTSINTKAFQNNKKITKITIGSNVTVIGSRAFYKCTKLSKVVLPAKVSQVGVQAFYGCKSLKSITIQTTKLSSKKVGSNAFKGIYLKANVKVPKSKYSSYKNLLKKKGASSKIIIK